jgi:hypothetical protein
MFWTAWSWELDAVALSPIAPCAPMGNPGAPTSVRHLVRSMVKLSRLAGLAGWSEELSTANPPDPPGDTDRLGSLVLRLAAEHTLAPWSDDAPGALPAAPALDPEGREVRARAGHGHTRRSRRAPWTGTNRTLAMTCRPRATPTARTSA